MKIVCENCGAKYSIADEKVKGKVFKIRCKKCSESILVRGDSNQPASESEPAPQTAPVQSRASEEETEAETRVFDYAGYHPGGEAEAVWHIVVDDQQQGPYTEAQIKEYLRTGSLTGDTLVWREGFDDWMMLSDVPALTGAAAAKPAAHAAAPAGGGLFDEQPKGKPQNSLFDEQPGGGLFSSPPTSASPFDSGGGLFSAGGGAPGGALGDVFSSATQEPAGGLFETGAKSSTLFRKKEEESGDEGIFSSTREPAAPAASPVAASPSPRINAAQAMMTGQRNENSVLFSLANLQALAAGPAPAAAKEKDSRKATPGFTSAGTHGEEASGLIDIRSLAGSLSTAEQSNAVDDLISMGGGGFSPALGAPVLAAQHEGMSNTVKIAIGGGAVAFLALIVVVLVLALSGNDESQTAAQAQILALQKQIEDLSKRGGSGDNAAALAQLQEELRKKQEAAGKEEGSTSGGSAPSVTGKEEGSSKKTSTASSGGSKKKTGKSGGSGGSSASESGGGDEAESATPTPTPTKAPSKVSELDDLLGGSGGGGGASKSKSSGGGSSSSNVSSGGSLGPAPKAALSREDVQKGMAAVAPAVQGCGQGKGGSITMNMTIGKTGRVSSASAIGAFAGTPIGDCAARAVRRAKFPESQQSLNVKYPFKL